MGRELLLEIGTEEIPARFLPPVLEEMAVSFRKMLDAERIGVGRSSPGAPPGAWRWWPGRWPRPSQGFCRAGSRSGPAWRKT